MVVIVDYALNSAINDIVQSTIKCCVDATFCRVTFRTYIIITIIYIDRLFILEDNVKKGGLMLTMSFRIQYFSIISGIMFLMKYCTERKNDGNQHPGPANSSGL